MVLEEGYDNGTHVGTITQDRDDCVRDEHAQEERCSTRVGVGDECDADAEKCADEAYEDAAEGVVCDHGREQPHR
eukprot:5785954-Prymnesium_polylepis.1